MIAKYVVTTAAVAAAALHMRVREKSYKIVAHEYTLEPKYIYQPLYTPMEYGGKHPT